MRKHLRAVPFVFVVIGLLHGCGGRSGVRGSVNVVGVVTMDGQPVEGATVSFSSDKFQSSGRTGTDGRYELSQDVFPGEYRITVSKLEGGAFAINPAEGMDEGQFAAMAAPPEPGGTQGPGSKGVPQLIPAQYSDPSQTTLKFTVPDARSAEANLRLRSK